MYLVCHHNSIKSCLGLLAKTKQAIARRGTRLYGRSADSRANKRGSTHAPYRPKRCSTYSNVNRLLHVSRVLYVSRLLCISRLLHVSRRPHTCTPSSCTASIWAVDMWSTVQSSCTLTPLARTWLANASVMAAAPPSKRTLAESKGCWVLSFIAS